MDTFRRPLRWLRQALPPLNFITIHYAYFIATCLLSAIILWGSSTPSRSLPFIDALFLAVSAMTLAGLNTVNLSTLNTFQQFLLFLLIILGSAIFVSAFVVHVRKANFEKKFVFVVEKRRQRAPGRSRGRSRSRRSHLSLSKRSPPLDLELPRHNALSSGGNTFGDDQKDEKDSHDQLPTAVDLTTTAIAEHDTDAYAHAVNDESIDDGQDVQPHSPGIQFRTDTVFRRQPDAVSPTPGPRRRHAFFNAQGVGARPTSSLAVRSRSRGGSEVDVASPPLHQGNRGDIGRYFDTVSGWVSRNSQFHGLTAREREQLGGYEYRAVKILSWLVPAYFILWQLLGCLGCAAWVALNRPDTARDNGLNPWWVGAFSAVSAFNNSGMSLLDANMTAFQTGYYLIITMGLMILAGNTAYPIFLRLIVWTMYKLAKHWGDRSAHWTEQAQTLKFLLDHPRRCYTNLFPDRHTWWLLLSIITLNGIDWAAFEILNIGNKDIEALPVGVRVIDGLFQALAVRSGGFYIVSIVQTRISLQVLYVVMMYISVYPVVITMRNSNVYEERSLGIYAEDEDEIRQSQGGIRSGFLRTLTGHFVTGGANAESNGTFVRQQLRAQLAHDAWTIVAALFFIMIVETSHFDKDPVNFSVFNFLFEIVSAYGCVGISIGIPWADYSFCGTWQKLSKLILCFVMLKGRHRGLPVAIDHAVLLPGEENDQAEEDDGRLRLARTISRGRQTDLRQPQPV